MNWTETQKEAICTRNKNIIVSAAAGSGKTAVLIERIYTLIIEQNIPIKKLLILTFTNAAAKEMKDRIYEKLSLHLENNPNDKFILDQIRSLPLAQISTMHSFCKNTLQEYFQLVNISPNFKIGNQSFLKLLKIQTLDEIFDEKYELENPNFLSLIDIYSDRQSDDNLKKILLDLYDDILNKISPIKWLEDSISSYALDDITESIHFKNFINSTKFDFIDILIIWINSLVQECNHYEELNGYRETLLEDFNLMQDLKNSLEISFDKYLEKVINFKFPRLKTGKKTENEEILNLRSYIKSERDIYKKMLKDSVTYEKSEEQTNIENKVTYPLLKEIVNILKDFDKKYKSKKRELDILSFSDLEHYMLEILKDKTTRKNISNRYDYIFYDEFQDSNTIHHEIINLIKKENNLFFVGDVKQSIYGFRNAEPEIFIETYDNYALDGKISTKIDLSENFRSSPQILNFINFIFENTMSKNLGAIDYDENAKLKSSIEYSYNNDKIGLVLIEKNDDNPDNIENEAIWTCNKIHSLLGKKYFDRKSNEEKEITYGDIAILFRSPASILETYKKIFKENDIPFYIESSVADFEVVEMGVFIDFLKIVDNFYQDDALLAVMTSIIGKFNIDEITKIKVSSEKKYFYETVLEYYKKNDDILSKKIKNFIKMIEDFSNNEKIMSLSDFINYSIEKTGYLNYISVLPQGNQRIKNLNILKDTAKEFEQNKNPTLYFFLIYLDKILNNKSDIFTQSTESSSYNMVRIMSIHKSKGLEFPVVFVNSLSKKFNKKDLQKPIQTNSIYGIGVDFFNTDLNTRYTTIQKEVIKKENNKKIMSEELRILYVALTRAKDYLFLVGSGTSNNIKKILSGENNKKPIESMSSYMDWIYKNITPNIENYEESLHFHFLKTEMMQIDEKEKNIDNKSVFINLVKNSSINDITKSIVKNFEYIYPYQELVKTKVKDSVTNLAANEKKYHNYKIEKLSDAIINTANSSNDFTKIGTLTHLVLQNIDYKIDYTLNDLNSLIDNLINRELITNDEKELIDSNIIMNFLKSNLAKRLKTSDKIYKEQSFITKYNNFILNGIIDLFFIEKGKIILIDFKTDNINNYNLNERISHYTSQIELYKLALEKAFSMKVSESYLYFLKLKDPILII